MITTILLTLSLCYIDGILEYFNVFGRYYLNHFFINSLISFYTFNDVILSYTEFNNIMNLPVNMTAIKLTYSIHFYHIIVYYNKFTFDDWLHHIIMVFFALPLGSYLKCGPIMGHSLFFLTGFPGGINYLLLFLQRNKLLEKQTQKYYNYYLNLLIRQPGCIAVSVIALLGMINFNYTLLDRIFISYIIASHYWNGIYFMEQVLRNYNTLYVL